MLDVKKENYGPETNVCHFSIPDYSNKYIYYTSGNKTKQNEVLGYLIGYP